MACLSQTSVASGYAGVYPGAYGHEAFVSAGAYRVGLAPGGAYRGPLASPVVLPSGYLADTPEVAAARSAHLAAVATRAGAYGAGSYSAGYGDGPYAGAGAAYASGVYGAFRAAAYGGASSAAGAHRYAGPLGAPVVLPSGYLADTHDVAAAKQAHLAAVANAAARSSYGHQYYH